MSAENQVPDADLDRRAAVAIYLERNGPLTVPEIAAGIRCRQAVVRKIVKGAGFRTTPAPPDRSRKAITYICASVPVATRPVSADESCSRES